MAPKNVKKEADTQGPSKPSSRVKHMTKIWKQEIVDLVDLDDEPNPSANFEVGLRRSARNLVTKNDTASSSSKDSVEKQPAKRKMDGEVDCEPGEKKVTRNQPNRSKKPASKDYGKSKCVKKPMKKRSRLMEEPILILDSDDEEEEDFINRLPVEVLTEIFTYLSFRDRKNTRLVCRRWFEANNVIHFAYEEKLLCYAIYDLDIIIKTLENSTRKIFNLEFYDIDFGSCSASVTFWRTCGPKIDSLLFSDCVLPDETLKEIIINCSRLKCLSLENMSNREEGLRMCSDTCLNELIDMGVRQESLYFFEMNINETGWVSNNSLRALFIIYPNVRQFSFYCDTVDDDFNTGDVADQALLQSTERCTFLSILRKLIDSQGYLDSITLDVGDYQTLDFLPACQICTAISPLYFPMLRDIKIDVELFGDQQQSILDFFSRHTLLQSVECQIFVEQNTAQFIGQLMNRVLDSCQHLQSMQMLQDVYLNHGFSLESSVFDKLRKSRLDSLSFNFGLDMAPSKVEIINYNLRSLCILAPGVEKHMFLTLCKTFRGLTHLEMCNIDDEGLQCVLKHVPLLTSLKLIDCENLTDFGFTGRDENDELVGYSIQSLDKLQYLELKISGDPGVKITEKTYNEFKFPELLYLHITIEHPWKLYTSFVESFLNFPKIEGIACYFDEIVNYSTWLDLCSQLKRLRYLHVQFREFKNFGDRKYKHMFDCCPTLRAFQHRCSTSSQSQSYYYDVVKQEVVKKRTEREYRISSEQIDMFSVNWMWF